MIGANVFFQFATVGEGFRLGAEPASVLGHFAARFNPRLDHFGITDGFDARPELLEWHMGEALLVVFDEPGLVLVEIRWAKNFAGHAAAIDKLEIAFGWIDRFFGTGEQRVWAVPEKIPERFVGAEKHAVTGREPGQDGGFASEFDGVAFGFVEHQLGEVEQGVGARGLFHHVGDAGQRDDIGQKCDVHIQRWWRRAHRSANRSGTGTFPARAAGAWCGPASVVPSVGSPVIASSGRWTPVAIAAVGFWGTGFAGMFIERLGRGFEPGRGQVQFI